MVFAIPDFVYRGGLRGCVGVASFVFIRGGGIGNVIVSRIRVDGDGNGIVFLFRT